MMKRKRIVKTLFKRFLDWDRVSNRRLELHYSREHVYNFVPVPWTLWEGEFKGDILILGVKISMKHSTQFDAWVLLIVLARFKLKVRNKI